MAERKKLTMYYPPDFDPRLVPRMKRDPNFTCEIRMMLPFSVQCNTCGEFMYMGKKFNSRKENAQGEKYKGIQILRFYIKCQTCGAEMSFKTDPENGDYVMESGGSRTFEMWKEKGAMEEANLKERLDEDQQDSMRALENRTLDSRMEMDMLDALDELKAINQRHQRVDTGSLLSAIEERRRQEATGGDLDEEDEALVKSIKFGAAGEGRAPAPGTLNEVPRDDDEDLDLVSALISSPEESGPGKKKGKKKGSKKHGKKRPRVPSTVDEEDGRVGDVQQGTEHATGQNSEPTGSEHSMLAQDQAVESATVKDATELLLESMARSGSAADDPEHAGDGDVKLKVKIKRKPAKKMKVKAQQEGNDKEKTATRDTPASQTNGKALSVAGGKVPESSSALGMLAGAYGSDDSD
eukprot:CAMPEP_0118983366 /NCGR_PEP_ID=MMETSP1173-20130426/35195_1 /TAXON_ID=1034831 /ORGANISM="Rhizochromulina marina cf, Strain CCMP1243" /LENGTH=408 /DNA_ID=CAMNT_0006933935 /DNA_START=36 /DNA_END=1262 /DNA_ORIENTATION=+